MSTKIRQIAMTDIQWRTVQSLAADASMSASEWVRRACSRAAASEGVDFEATPRHGGPRTVEYRRTRGDIGPFVYEWAEADGNTVIRSGSHTGGAEWRGGDPLADLWVGATVADLLAARFEPPGKWRPWAIAWGRMLGEIE